MAIDIVKRTSTANTTYFPGRSIKYIVFHYTAGSSSRTGSARGVASMFSNPTVGGSADFIVDDTEIVQFSPDVDNYYCWHSGVDYSGGTAPYWGKCTNANSIGIEVCSTNTNYKNTDPANSPKWSFTDAAVETALKLIKHLMQKYNIPASNVIRHWDVCRKACPGIIGWNTYNGSNESKWLAFKQKLGSTATTTTNTKTDTASKTLYRVQCGAFMSKSNADKLMEELKKKGFKDAFIAKDTCFRVQCGAFKEKANAEALKKKLQSAGYKDAYIVVSPSATIAKKTVAELADEVIHGKWGNGQDRVNRLTAAGYDAAAVQRKVNELMSK